MDIQDYQASPSFSLAYGMEAILPVKICMPTLRTTEIDQSQNAIQLGLAQDQSEERRGEAQICIATYQQQIKASHHKKVEPREFQIGRPSFKAGHSKHQGEQIEET